jgi:hypothetical protein
MSAFAERTESIAPTKFKDEFERFLISVSHDLSTTGPAPWADDPDEPIMPRTPVPRDESPAAVEQDEQLAVWGPA